jgi:hypothetical protein
VLRAASVRPLAKAAAIMAGAVVGAAAAVAGAGAAASTQAPPPELTAVSVGTKAVPVGPSLGKPSASADGVRDRRPPSPSEEVCESAWAGKAFELGRHRPVLQRAGAAEAVAVAAPVAVEAAGGHVGPQPMQRVPMGKLSEGAKNGWWRRGGTRPVFAVRSGL